MGEGFSSTRVARDNETQAISIQFKVAKVGKCLYKLELDLSNAFKLSGPALD